MSHWVQNPEKWKNWYPGADSASFIYNNGKITGIATGNNNGIKLETISDSLIVAANADKRMRMGWQIFPAATPNTTTIQWYMNFKLRWYPWEKFSSLLLEKRYGPMMEKGLSVLKKFAEKKWLTSDVCGFLLLKKYCLLFFAGLSNIFLIFLFLGSF